MTNRALSRTLLLAAALSTGCEFYSADSARARRDATGGRPGNSAAEPGDEAAIREAAREFSRSFEAGDTTTLGMLYTEDALLLAPSDTVRGRAAIRRWFRPRAGGNRFEHSLETDDLYVEGDVAVDRGRWSQKFADEEGEARTVSGVYLATWRRGADGRWRMEYDMWHAPYE